MDDNQPIYPSAQQGFIPLDFSSPVQKPTTRHKTPYTHQQTPYRNNFHHQQKHTPYRYQQQHNHGRNTGGGGGVGFYQQNKWNYQQNRRGGGSAGNTQNRKKLDVNISQYIHPSMLEDPWKELLERQNAMKGSLEDSADENNESDTDIESTNLEE